MNDKAILTCKECGSRKILYYCSGCRKKEDIAERLITLLVSINGFSEKNSKQLEVALRSINKKRMEVVAFSCGLGFYPNATLEEIAKHLSTTKEFARQRIAIGLKDIRKALNDNNE